MFKLVGKTAYYGDDTQFANIIINKNPIAFFGFSSIAKMIDHIKNTDYSMKHKSGFNSESNFRGTSSMNEANELASHGWNEGIEMASEIIERINVKNPTSRKRSYSVAGGSVNVGRMLAGNPNNMRTRTRQPTKKIITLYNNFINSANINENDMKIRAAIIGAICDQLENNDYSCEIVNIANFQSSQRNSAVVSCIVKKAGEPMNLSNLIYACGHPSFLRRHAFAVVASIDQTQIICNNRYGNVEYYQIFNNSDNPVPNDSYELKIVKHNSRGTLDERIKQIAAQVIPDNLPIEFEV